MNPQPNSLFGTDVTIYVHNTTLMKILIVVLLCVAGSLAMRKALS